MAELREGKVEVGSTAPDFSLPDQHGRLIRLSDFLGKKTVVLAFYIKAFTGGCTRELSTYQADVGRFDASQVQVIGISVDRPEKNKAYAESLGLTFPILSDNHRSVSRQYGVLMPLIRLAKRVTFVIDKQGKVQSIQRGGEAMDPEKALAACGQATGPGRTSL
ncbi:MAG: redoxin domain-containing protein [Terriglobia bacterium]